MPRDTTPTKRIVLMEFQVPAGILSEEPQKALEAQIGDADGHLPSELTILVPVAEAEGGPKEVIDEVAKTAGAFRAPPLSGWPGKRMDPPPDSQLVMSDLD